MSCARSLLSNFYSFVSFPCSNHVELSGWSDLTAAHVRVLVGMMFPNPTTNHFRRYIPSKRVSGSIVSSLNGCVCARARKKDWDRVGRIDFTQWEGSWRREGKGGAMIWGMRSQGPGLRLRCVCSQSAQPVLLFYPSPSPSLLLFPRWRAYYDGPCARISDTVRASLSLGARRPTGRDRQESPSITTSLALHPLHAPRVRQHVHASQSLMGR